ncbi:hypothetical protein BJV82DRAFT_581607 [Fennellomyces sp. T-0311]|nr:hypothetical protein BJV82DRAFT_581607 [Fennellomyces sp. T-0311]
MSIYVALTDYTIKNFENLYKTVNGSLVELHLDRSKGHDVVVSNMNITSDQYLGTVISHFPFWYNHDMTLDTSHLPNYPTLLDAVTKHCPVLENLCYKRTAVGYKIRTTYTPTSSVSTNNGLKTLVFHPKTAICSGKKKLNINPQLCALLQRGCGTRQVLDLNLLQLDGIGYNSTTTLAQHGSPMIQTLVIHSPGDSLDITALPELISACSSLANIKMVIITMSCIDTLVKLYFIRQFSMNFRQSAKATSNNGEISIEKVTSLFSHSPHLHSFSLNASGATSFSPTNQLVFDVTQAIGSSTIPYLDVQKHKLTTE